MAGASASVLAGCVSPVAMQEAAIAYDRTVSRVTTELLLLNIARSRWYHPVHFTAISSIAATFEFRVDAGISGLIAAGGSDGATLALSGSASENPTVTIIPVQGEEFTKRLLTPMQGGNLQFMLQRGADPAIVLRLMAEGIQVDEGDRTRFLANRPSRPLQYDAFRKRVLHLSWLWQSRNLFINRVPVGDGDRSRAVLTNYDREDVSAATVESLYRRLEDLRDDQVLVDIDPSFPGGNYPLLGYIQLRSFKAIIAFLGRGISEEPEFAVDSDPRTGDAGLNPASTLGIRETRQRPTDAVFVAEERGFWYAIDDPPDDPGLGRWNRQAFDVLYQLYQLTVTDVSRTPAPLITISR